MFALSDGFPASPGHTLVMPKRVVATWFEATRDEQVPVLEPVDEVKVQLDAEFQAHVGNGQPARQLGEREGSGGPKIRHAWLAQHWQMPVLHADAELAETHLHLSQIRLLPETSAEALRRQWGSRFVALGELAGLILVTAHAEGRVTHARIRELADQHSRDVTPKLQKLVRARVWM